MPIISMQDIVNAAAKAGFPHDQLATAGAVAMAESSGNTTARNSIGASGLWQILQSAHPEFAAQWKSGAWKDPVENARMALSVWQAAGKSWRPWVQYTTGVYRVHLTAANTAVAKVDPNAVVNAAPATLTSAGADSGIAGSIGSIQNAIQFIINPHNWFRIAMFVMGSIMVFWGLSHFMDLSAITSKLQGLKSKALMVGEVAAL
jgi:hypothetical protein